MTAGPGTWSAALAPRGWGVPFKLALMGGAGLVIAHGEGLLPDRGVPFALAGLGVWLAQGEARAPRPTRCGRGLAAVTGFALLLATPRGFELFLPALAGGVAGSLTGAFLARRRA